MGLEYGLPLELLEVKEAGADAGWQVAGYASTHDLDEGGDMVVPGAFQKSLATGRRVQFLRQHDPARVLGVPLELHEDDSGLFGKFKISRTALGEETPELLRDGALSAFSIGFKCPDSEYRKDGVRLLKEISLYEVSLVSTPMNERALVTALKSGPGGLAELPFDGLWQQVRDGFLTLEGAVHEAKALYGRRTAEGRALSPRHREALAKVLAMGRLTLHELAQLVGETDEAKAPARPVPSDAAAPSGGVDLRLRLHEARRRLTAAGIIEAGAS
jgi:HK97 family phage prohead protease